MSGAPSREEWAALLAAVEDPAPGRVATALADARDLADGHAHDVVKAGLEDGTLAYDPDAGLLGAVSLADENGDVSDPSDEPTEESRPATDPIEALQGAAEVIANADGATVTVSTALPRPTPTTPLDEGRAVRDRTFHPNGLTSREWWAPWVLAYGYYADPDDPEEKPSKQPVAPYMTGTADPVPWRATLPDEEHPTTTYGEAIRWDGLSVGADLPASERVVSDRLGAGIIIPVGGGDGEPVTLLDWDDVRDPETEEIHPVCAAALRECDGYAEISQSGEGIHQFVYGKIPGGYRKFIRHIDDEPWVGDDRPMVEMYCSGRVVAMTGLHVEGTGEDLVDGQALVDELCWRFGTGTNNQPGRPSDPFARERDGTAENADDTPSHKAVGAAMHEAVAYDGEDPAEWDVPEGESLAYHAVLRACARSDDHPTTANWELMGYAAGLGHADGQTEASVVEDLTTVPAPEYNARRVEKEVRSVWRKAERGNYHPPSPRTLVERGLLPAECLDDETGRAEEAAAYARADTTALRNVEVCAPLGVEHTEIDVEERRKAMRGDAYAAFRDSDALTLWTHNAGEGKTTTVPLAAVDHDDRHVVALPTHENCHEFRADPAKPDGYFHLKGAGQPTGEECMGAKVSGETCPTHGAAECPTMCPIYSALPDDHDLRQRFDRLVPEVGVRAAHRDLRLWDEEWHGDSCPWQEQFQALDGEDRVVTVHEYLTLKSVRQHGKIFVDDLQGHLEDEKEQGATALRLAAGVFADLAADARDDEDGRVFGALAAFTVALAEETGTGTLTQADLSGLDAPTFDVTRTRVYPAEEDVPESLDVVETEPTTYRDYVGDNSGDHQKADGVAVTVREDTAEVLSRAARRYYDRVHARYRDGRDEGEPLDLTGILAALGAASDDDHPARLAARQPVALASCLRCGSELAAANGRRHCPSCGWDEEHGPFTVAGDPARVSVRARDDENGGDGIEWLTLPTPSDLPNPAEVLILDATPRRRLYAALWGISSGDVKMFGHEPYALPNATVIQTVDGAYHRGIITANDSTRGRLQGAIDRVAEVHDSVLFVAPLKAKDAFAFPENAEVMHYGALRGLNRAEYDAVVCIGSLHAREDVIRRKAALLAQDHPHVRAGGEAYTTRDDDDTDPIWRKYDYVDDEGRGRAVATKGYSGLTGDLFQSVREDELEQAIHRVRPILADADEPKHVYLLTNVPTRVPVDYLTTIAGLTDPLKASLGVSDTATTLLEAMCAPDDDVTADGGTVEGTRAEWEAAVAGLDVAERTVQKAMKDLRDAGYVESGGYASSGAMTYRATRTAVAAVTENWRRLL